MGTVGVCGIVMQATTAEGLRLFHAQSHIMYGVRGSLGCRVGSGIMAFMDNELRPCC